MMFRNREYRRELMTFEQEQWVIWEGKNFPGLAVNWIQGTRGVKRAGDWDVINKNQEEERSLVLRVS